MADDEQSNIRVLLRVVALFIAWPAWSIGIVLMVIDFDQHVLHSLGFAVLGLAALVLWFRAPAFAAKFAPSAEPAE